MLIKDIYHCDVITIDQNTSVVRALRLLITKKINGLVVVNDQKQVVGVLALQDIAAATIPNQFKHNLGMAAAMYKKGFFHEMCVVIKDQPVKTIMRRKFECVNLHDNIMAITAEFLKNDLYIVPVIEKGKLLGIVTRSEIKKALAYGMDIDQRPQREL